MKKHAAFFITEGVLLGAAAFYRFVLLVYITLSCCCLFVAFVVLLYYLLNRLSKKKPKPARVLKIVLTVLLACGCTLFAAAETTVVRAAHTDQDPSAPYCIVLGAKVNGETPTLSLEERLTAAKDYMEKYPQAKAVLSGGQGSGRASPKRSVCAAISQKRESRSTACFWRLARAPLSRTSQTHFQ